MGDILREVDIISGEGANWADFSNGRFPSPPESNDYTNSLE